MTGVSPVISGAELSRKNAKLQIDLEHRLNRWFQETSNRIGDALKGKYRLKKFSRKASHLEASDAEGDDLQTELLVGGKRIPKIQSNLIRALALLGWKAVNWEELVAIVQPYLEEAAKEGVSIGAGQVQMKDARQAQRSANESAESYASRRSAEMAGMRRDPDGGLIDDEDARWPLTDVLRRDIEASITMAVTEGWTADQLAAVIDASYALSPQRAKVVANTEITNAQSGGTYALWGFSGTVTLVRWVMSDLERDPDECDGYEAQGVVPLGHEFDEGLFHPRAHPNCRCELQEVDPEEEMLEQ